MKLVIENVVFPYNEGCKILKLKGGNSPFEELADIWDDIVPMSFSEIAGLPNLEQRRIALNYLGIDKLVSQVEPRLISKKTLKKKTSWINEKGEFETLNFDDTYELYGVSNRLLLGQDRWGQNQTGDSYYVKCKDTSTDREYLIWVDLENVFVSNNPHKSRWDFSEDKVDAIDCIAWTITTNVPKNNIETIIRQGDCILIKPKDPLNLLHSQRHLTASEYKTLLKLES